MEEKWMNLGEVLTLQAHKFPRQIALMGDFPGLLEKIRPRLKKAALNNHFITRMVMEVRAFSSGILIRKG